MEEHTLDLTAAEWNVMECLWEDGGRAKTGREVAQRLAETAGWSRSTALTMLARMEKKGLVACDGEGKLNRYRALASRGEAARRQTESFLSRVYRGSVRAMLSAMAEQAELTDADIDGLYAVLDEIRGERK